MKHLFLTLAFAACWAAPAFSQFHFGLSGSANLSFWDWHIKSLDTDIDYEPGMGWRYAAMGEWQAAPWIGLRAELGTQVKSNKLAGLQFPDMISTGNYRERYQYWEGSLLLELFPVKKWRAVYLLGGATAGNLGRGRTKVCITENGEKSCNTTPIDLSGPNYNRSAFSLDGGIGGNVPLGALSRLKIEGRFQYGLSNFSKNDNVDARVSSVLFTLGYLHRL